jgi:hypothetical protein
LTFAPYPLTFSNWGFDMLNKLIIFLVSCICLSPSLSYARLEFTPAISIGELYDDNIDLEKTNKKTDWITTVSPSVNLNLISENSSLLFNYAPTIVRYKNRDQYNALRHSGALTFNENFSRQLRFNLTDTFVRSEDPIEQTAGIYGIRQTRNVYQRNDGNVSVSYLFGAEDTLKLGYNNSFLNNKDITLEDNAYSKPYAELIYRFNIKNGIELNYQRTLADFSRDDNGIPSDAYTGNTIGAKYSYSFSPHTIGTVNYNLNTRVFKGATENYDIHEGDVGLTHTFSTDATLSLSGGYFQLKNEHSPDDNGFSYNGSLTKNFSRGNFTIGGTGGWREGYQEAVRTGLIKYWGADSHFSYQIAERFENHASLSYMHNKEEASGRKYNTYSGSYGWRLSFLRWFSLAIDYTRSDRRDNIDAFSYVDNRVMMSLMAGRLYK